MIKEQKEAFDLEVPTSSKFHKYTKESKGEEEKREKIEGGMRFRARAIVLYEKGDIGRKCNHNVSRSCWEH